MGLCPKQRFTRGRPAPRRQPGKGRPSGLETLNPPRSPRPGIGRLDGYPRAACVRPGQADRTTKRQFRVCGAAAAAARRLCGSSAAARRWRAGPVPHGCPARAVARPPQPAQLRAAGVRPRSGPARTRGGARGGALGGRPPGGPAALGSDRGHHPQQPSPVTLEPA